MRNSGALLCVSLILCGLVTECFGYTIMPKDKRGWTLNSAGYLLGPHAHRTLTDKGNVAGKREATEETYKLGRETFGPQVHSLDENTVQTVLDFLSYLHLKELGALDHLAVLISEESAQQ
ncbi:galanin peptides-like [Spea bombifrons]|uniref:galanin peptides-like n=1 Tax=Spea bombifrons TaxID=233779 RepID=UPI00234B1131|nr:galanin peptides-like [Spea bombifrons]XP_053307961.1 galanin peptides-like [Spea bombifrons]